MRSESHRIKKEKTIFEELITLEEIGVVTSLRILAKCFICLFAFIEYTFWIEVARSNPSWMLFFPDSYIYVLACLVYIHCGVVFKYGLEQHMEEILSMGVIWYLIVQYIVLNHVHPRFISLISPIFH